MNVVILGGSGLIGRALTRSLIDAGHSVMVLSRDARRSQTLVTAGATVATWAPQDVAELASYLGEADAVVNLAGAPVGPWPWTAARRRSILTSRLGPTAAVVVALALLPPDERPGVLVNASGTDRYTGLDAAPAEESSPSAVGFLASVCAAWEAHAVVAEALGVRVVLLRTGFVVAEAGPIMRLFALPFRLGLGGPLGDGRQWFSWVHIDDVVGIVLAALEDDRYRGPINVVSPAPVREADLALAIGRVLRRPVRVRIPARLIRMAMGESSTLALGSRRVIPGRALGLGYRFRWVDLDAALRSALTQPMAGPAPASSSSSRP